MFSLFVDDRHKQSKEGESLLALNVQLTTKRNEELRSKFF